MDYNKLADDLLSGCEENCADCEYAGDIEYECSISQLAAKAITELLTRAEAAEAEIEQLRNEHMKIQYDGEELTVQEICERLERAETRAEKKIKQLTPCDRCAYDPPSSGDGKPCSFCPASKKEG